MEIYKRIKIDWIKTANRLVDLRLNNKNLIKYVCYFNKKMNENKDSRFINKYTCYQDYNCDNCTEMDQNISQQELANVFGVSRYVINNWENSITIPDIEDILLYSKISGVDIYDILVWE